MREIAKLSWLEAKKKRAADAGIDLSEHVIKPYRPKRLSTEELDVKLAEYKARGGRIRKCKLNAKR